MTVTAFVKGVLFLFHPTFAFLFYLHDGVNVPIGVFLFLF